MKEEMFSDKVFIFNVAEIVAKEFGEWCSNSDMIYSKNQNYWFCDNEERPNATTEEIFRRWYISLEDDSKTKRAMDLVKAKYSEKINSTN